MIVCLLYMMVLLAKEEQLGTKVVCAKGGLAPSPVHFKACDLSSKVEVLKHFLFQDVVIRVSALQVLLSFPYVTA